MGRQFIDTPIGTLKISSENGFIVGISLCERGQDCPDSVTNTAAVQLHEYFEGKRFDFDLPIKLIGDGFCLKVWQAISTISYGKTVTYADIAALAGRPKAYRSAGSCCGKNPILIVVPCHRVVAGNGIGGFGAGTEIKRFLLKMENSQQIQS